MSRSTPDPMPLLLAELTAWLRTGVEELPGAVKKALGQPALATSLMTWAVRELRRRGAIERQLQELMGIHHELMAQVETLTAPPRPVARLIRVDRELRTAWVATSTSMHFEVGLAHEVDVDSLAAGGDVVLTPDRTCVLRALPEGARSSGAVRLLRVEGWLPRAEPGAGGEGLRAARAIEHDRPVVAWVPPSLEKELGTRLDDTVAATSVLVDEFGQVVGIEDPEEVDPMQAAARFVIPLDAIEERDVRGLAREKAAVRAAVERVPSLGAFVLAEGPPGSGKTWIARWARHLLEQTADVVVLGLPPSRDHRYHGQHEADVHDLCRVAEKLVQGGRLVLVFLDEVDAHFFKSIYGHSTYTNAQRATWLSLLGGGIDARGILFYATTNKADHLPDEFLNRVTHPLSFAALTRDDARGILAMHLASLGSDEELAPVLDALADMTFDETAATVVAEVKLRSQKTVPLYPKDFRQVSARFFVETARDIVQDLTLDGDGDALPEVEHAVGMAAARLSALLRTMRLTPANVADRTFVEFDVRDPAEDVRLVEQGFADDRRVFRYTPLEI